MYTIVVVYIDYSKNIKTPFKHLEVTTVTNIRLWISSMVAKFVICGDTYVYDMLIIGTGHTEEHCEL